MIPHLDNRWRLRRTATALLILTLIICSLSGCGSYSQSTQHSRVALLQGRADLAVAELNTQLEVERGAESELLLILERALALQQNGEYRGSSKDLIRADSELEMIDYTKTPLKDLGVYLYSDDSSPYRPSPFEKAMVNVLNIVNFLMLNEWSRAKVEARRLGVLESYWGENLSKESRQNLGQLKRFVHWLKAFTFIATGSPTLAHKEAKLGGFQLPSVPERSPGAKYSPVIVISASGMVPHKVAQRLPLGRALLYIGPHPHWSARERQALARIQAKGLVKWLNFPTLSNGVEGRTASIRVNQLQASPTAQVDLTRLAERAYEDAKPLLITAAITRLISRALVGGITESLVKKKSNGAVGLLVGLIAEGAMASADTPDTRSWTTLPAQLDLYWLWLPPGTHQLRLVNGAHPWQTQVTVSGDGRPITFNVPLSRSMASGQDSPHRE